MSKFIHRTMLLGSLACALFAASIGAQTVSPSITGDYIGQLGQLHLALHVHQDPAGTLTGALDSLDQRANGIPCVHFEVSGTQLSFDVPSIRGSYKGDVSVDRNTIVGTWIQGPPLPLIFTRHQFAPVPATEQATKFAFDFAGKSRTSYFFIPDCKEPMPIVLLLHGSGRRGEVMVDVWRPLASKEHFIVVAPDAYDSSAWDTKADPPDFLHAVVEQVKAKHAIDENRIYLFGHSAGAVYALILSILDSHYFAATALHAGALPPDYNKLFAYAGRRVPIAIWVGDHDQFFPLDSVAATKKGFEANGFPIKLTVVPNHDHNYYQISDQINTAAWDFLKNIRLRTPDKKDQH